MELQNILQKLGLSENEIRIYSVNLELGMTQVANIARLSGIKRTTLYGVLERMEEKTIIKKHIKNKVAYYEALNPDELHDAFETQLKNLKKKLPELRALNNKFTTKPKIYFYEGAENVAELYKMEVQDKPEKIYIFSSNADRKTGEINELRKLRNQIYEKAKKKPDMHVILNREANKSEQAWSEFHSKTISTKELDIGISIKIYGNKTKFISMKDTITGVVIENEEIARTMKSIFEYIYN